MLPNSTLKSKVNALWDRFWGGGISNPLTAIEQRSYFNFGTNAVEKLFSENEIDEVIELTKRLVA